MKKLTFIVVAAIILLGAGYFVQLQTIHEREADILPLPGATSSSNIGPATSVKLGKISADAEIIYPTDGYIYTMDRNGGNVAQITFGEPRQYEHVGVSRDRRYVAASQVNGTLWIYDLKNGTEAKVLGFAMAGNGSHMEFDKDGYLYFAAARPNKAADIYKMKADGTKLIQLTDTPQVQEADVSVSNDGKLAVFIKGYPKPKPPDLITTEVWLMNSDGSNAKMLKRAERPGRAGSEGIADPDFADNDTRILFSERDYDVPSNFPSTPGLNTAHDIWIMDLAGANLRRITEPGPISIIPHWKDGLVLYNESSEKKNTHWDSALIREDGTGYKVIRQGTGFAQWIP